MLVLNDPHRVDDAAVVRAGKESGIRLHLFPVKVRGVVPVFAYVSVWRFRVRVRGK